MPGLSGSPAASSPSGWPGSHAWFCDHSDVGESAVSHDYLADRQHRLGLGSIALERADHEREPGLTGEQPDCHAAPRLRSRFSSPPSRRCRAAALSIPSSALPCADRDILNIPHP